jgi:molecular chaperone DnaK
MTTLIERNTTIPTTKSEIFSTAADNQTAVTVQVFQGERQMASDNRQLGHFNLEGIPLAPRGTPQIEVSFDIDANGILNVKATDKATSKEQSVRIEDSSGLSEEEIDSARKDGEAFAEEDKLKRELAEARNKATMLTHETEKLMKEHADKLDEDSKAAIEASIEKVNTAIDGEDAAAINTALEELTQATHALSKHMYDAAEGNETSEEAPPETTVESSEQVIDAEFEKKDE